MENKNSIARMQVIFGTLFFALVLFGELYTMLVYPQMYLVMLSLAILSLGGLYLIVSGLFKIKDIKERRREEQYDSIFKSEKASYLMLKKYFEEIEEKLSYLEKVAKVPTEEIVNAQKGIAKVIVNRSRENTDALLNSNELMMEQMNHLSEKLDNLFTMVNQNGEVLRSDKDVVASILTDFKNEILRDQRDIISGSENAVKLHNQELVVNLKDMELRLNTALMQSQKVVAQAPVMAAASPVVMPVTEVVPQPEAVEEVMPEPVEEAVPEPIEEVVLEPEAVPEPEPIPEPVEEETTPPMPDLSDPNRAMSPDEIAALLANMGGSTETEPAPVEPEAVEEVVPEPEPIPEPVEEEATPPMPDLSDPNRAMSPDEIAALFANMGGSTETEPAPVEPEAVEEEVPEPEAIPEPVEEEATPSMPDLSDPNRAMSPDEIAALFANLGN